MSNALWSWRPFDAATVCRGDGGGGELEVAVKVAVVEVVVVAVVVVEVVVEEELFLQLCEVLPTSSFQMGA